MAGRIPSPWWARAFLPPFYSSISILRRSRADIVYLSSLFLEAIFKNDAAILRAHGILWGGVAFEAPSAVEVNTSIWCKGRWLLCRVPPKAVVKCEFEISPAFGFAGGYSVLYAED